VVGLGFGVPRSEMSGSGRAKRDAHVRKSGHGEPNVWDVSSRGVGFCNFRDKTMTRSAATWAGNTR